MLEISLQFILSHNMLSDLEDSLFYFECADNLESR